MANCLEYAKERTDTCAEWDEQGMNGCQGWSPWFKWLCLSWTFISNLVCIGWVWATTGTCLVWEVVTTVADAIVDTVEFILSPVLQILGIFVELVFAIPIVGRALKWIWNLFITVAVNTLLSAFSGLFDAAAWAVGIRPQKKLRICTLIMSDENGRPLVSVPAVVEYINETIRIWQREANVQILNSAPVQYHNYLRSSPILADESWVNVVSRRGTSSSLDAMCSGPSLLEDLGVEGSERAIDAMQSCAFGIARRVIGYGAPVTVFIVRTVDSGEAVGCALGPLTDYVVVSVTARAGKDLMSNAALFDKSRFPHQDTLAHELGHKCNLSHVASTNNLMYEFTATDSKLNTWQQMLVRASRHVTYA